MRATDEDTSGSLMPSLETLRPVLSEQLVPRERVVATAARGADDPQWERIRAASYPWRLVLSALSAQPELVASLARAADWTGARVLDAGCGPGLITRMLAGLGADHVIGVDQSPRMLGVATSLTPGGLAAAVEFRAADLRLLPFPDATFDSVFCGDVPVGTELRTELLRVLRPGGTLIWKLTGLLPGCTFVWDPAFELRVRLAAVEGMHRAGPPWSERLAGSPIAGLLHGVPWQDQEMWTTSIERVAPVPAEWEAEELERFATFEGAFIHDAATPEDWATLCTLYDPTGAGYLFARPDGYFARPLTFVVARAPTD